MLVLVSLQPPRDLLAAEAYLAKGIKNPRRHLVTRGVRAPDQP